MSTLVSDDIVILNPARNNYIGLDATGRRLWDLLAEPMKVEDLCRQLTEEYDGNTSQIPADVLEFVEGLSQEGLLETCSE